MAWRHMADEAPPVATEQVAVAFAAVAKAVEADGPDRLGTGPALGVALWVKATSHGEPEEEGAEAALDSAEVPDIEGWAAGEVLVVGVANDRADRKG
jgi:hypothetical protein